MCSVVIHSVTMLFRHRQSNHWRMLIYLVVVVVYIVVSMWLWIRVDYDVHIFAIVLVVISDDTSFVVF